MGKSKLIMGVIRNLTICGLASLGLTALVLETDVNITRVADFFGAGCETQKEIMIEHLEFKGFYLKLK